MTDLPVDRPRRRSYTFNGILSLITLFGIAFFIVFLIMPGGSGRNALASVDRPDPESTPVPEPPPEQTPPPLPTPPKPTPPPDEVGKEWCEKASQLADEREKLIQEILAQERENTELMLRSCEVVLAIAEENFGLAALEGVISINQTAETLHSVVVTNLEADLIGAERSLASAENEFSVALNERARIYEERKKAEEELEEAISSGSSPETIRELSDKLREIQTEYDRKNEEIEIITNHIGDLAARIDGVEIALRLAREILEELQSSIRYLERQRQVRRESIAKLQQERNDISLRRNVLDNLLQANYARMSEVRKALKYYRELIESRNVEC